MPKKRCRSCKTSNAFDLECQVVMRVSKAIIIDELQNTINSGNLDTKDDLNQIGIEDYTIIESAQYPSY